jgi:hypothetical protein
VVTQAWKVAPMKKPPVAIAARNGHQELPGTRSTCSGRPSTTLVMMVSRRMSGASGIRKRPLSTSSRKLSCCQMG